MQIYGREKEGRVRQFEVLKLCLSRLQTMARSPLLLRLRLGHKVEVHQPRVRRDELEGVPPPAHSEAADGLDAVPVQTHRGCKLSGTR